MLIIITCMTVDMPVTSQRCHQQSKIFLNIQVSKIRNRHKV